MFVRKGQPTRPLSENLLGPSRNRKQQQPSLRQKARHEEIGERHWLLRVAGGSLPSVFCEVSA